MFLSLEDVVGQASRHPLANPSEFKILWDNDESQAGVYLPLEAGQFILAEDSDYRPMTEEEYGFPLEEADDAPFQTSGEQLLIDLGASRYRRQEIDYREGEIQGLVYALYAIRHGGKLDTEHYRGFINNTVIEMVREADDDWGDLTLKAVAKLNRAGYATRLSVPARTKAVR